MTNPDSAEMLKPPPLRLRVGEGRFLAELPRLARRLVGLQGEPSGGGEPVLVVPGLGFGDGAMAPLRGYLRSRGYQALRWGLGRNRGDVGRLLPRVVDLAVRSAERFGQPVQLVGWSLGGLLAREAARERPHAVARVITLGTPVIGGPRYTVAAGLYRRLGYDLKAVEEEMARRNEQPLPVPVTAIHARQDGVVAWRACIDRNPGVENLGIKTTHAGLTVNPEVYRIVARRLATPVTDWRARLAA